jgi:hypothetical protein
MQRRGVESRAEFRHTHPVILSTERNEILNRANNTGEMKVGFNTEHARAVHTHEPGDKLPLKSDGENFSQGHRHVVAIAGVTSG